MPPSTYATGVTIRCPAPGDAGEIWHLCSQEPALDLNSPYAYLLWCRDFAGTTRVAEEGGSLIGYVTAYRRPVAPETIMVWQVAVVTAVRRNGIAISLIKDLVEDRPAEVITYLEATVTAGNEASRRLFGAVARMWGAQMTEEPLFPESDFPVPHEAEILLRIGPLRQVT